MRLVNGFWIPDSWNYGEKSIGEQIAYSSDWELAIPYIRDWGVAIDGGANIGAWTRRLARKFSLVYAVEPNPDTFEALRENVGDLGNVRLVHAALGKSSGSVHLDGFGFGCHVGDGEGIPMITIDSLSTVPGFIKLDIEGYEYNALMGAPQALGNKPVVMFEDKYWFRYGTPRPRDHLLGLGYRKIRQIHRDHIYAHDSES